MTTSIVIAITVTASPAAAQDDEPEDERLTISADARFRLEDTLEAGQRPARFRGRLRYRLQATYEPTPKLRVGARVTTGNPEDPNSPYQDLGETFERFPLSMDRLFLAWTPVRQLQITAGKFGHSFLSNPVYGELVWDADVQPEGLAVRYLSSTTAGRAFGSGVVGHYTLLEQSRASESDATVAQIGGELPLARGVVARAAVGYYAYRNLTPDGAADVLLKNRGNSIADINGDGAPDAFASGFRILDTMLHFRFSESSSPLYVGGQYWRNFEAEIADDSGWALGGSYGALVGRGDWRLYYQFQRVEQDSVFASFVQDDFVHTTNYDGHILGAARRVLPNADLHFWALGSRPIHAKDGENPRIWRLRADFTLVF